MLLPPALLLLALWSADARAQPSETVRFHHPNGQLREEFTRNERGNKHGPAREFGADGHLLRESTYEDGREVGFVRLYHPGGVLRRVGFNSEPGRELAHVEYTTSGQLSELRCGPRPVLAPAADDARLCGFGSPADVQLFDHAGRVKRRLRYVEGRLERMETLHANGQAHLVEERTGNRRSERSYNEQGRLLLEKSWTDGELAVQRSYYLNGQLRSSTEWQRGAAPGQRVVREYHDNGTIASQGTYVLLARNRTAPVGAHEHFDAQGRKRAETLYDPQGQPARQRAWDEQGKLETDEEVFPDGSRKAFSR